MATFTQESTITAPAAEVFSWHLRDGAFEDLVPPWDSTRVAERSGRLEDNSLKVILSVPILGPIRQRWSIRHEGFEQGRRFCDVMERGPFKLWHHEHLVEPIDENSCRLIDTINYELPLGKLGKLGGSRMVRSRLVKTFNYRHNVTKAAFQA
jgi:ligand-binding SRPBCC domain-containing protein